MVSIRKKIKQDMVMDEVTLLMSRMRRRRLLGDLREGHSWWEAQQVQRS